MARKRCVALEATARELAAETNRRVLSLAADVTSTEQVGPRFHLVAVLDDLVLNRGKPKIIRSITARYLNGFDFSRLCAPTDNAFIEAFKRPHPS